MRWSARAPGLSGFTAFETIKPLGGGADLSASFNSRTREHQGDRMTLELLTGFAWLVWLGLILLFLVIEIFTLDFTFLMIAIGSLGGLVAAVIGLPWFVQLIVAAALSLLLIFAVRPPLIHRLRRGADPALTLVDALIGSGGIVSTSFVGNQGHVKLSNGENWTARLGAGATESAPVIGDHVVVIAIEGATAIVEPAEGKNS
jgi:membrane protein implicated in regulation of membrane protease activity